MLTAVVLGQGEDFQARVVASPSPLHPRDRSSNVLMVSPWWVATDTVRGTAGPWGVPILPSCSYCPCHSTSLAGARDQQACPGREQDGGPTCHVGRTFSMSFRLIPSPSSCFPFPHLDHKTQKSIERMAHQALGRMPYQALVPAWMQGRRAGLERCGPVLTHSAKERTPGVDSCSPPATHI